MIKSNCDKGWKIFNTKYSGKVAGNLHTTQDGYKYISLGIFGKNHTAHRAAWLIMSDYPLPEQIDHINRIGTDNRWSNLRASNPELNSKNNSKRTDNKSGVTGVFWIESSNKWWAYCNTKGQRNNLGYFSELSCAEEAVLKFRSENGFSSGHGKELAHYYR